MYAKIKFDFSTFFDHYPCGLICSIHDEDGKELAEDDYFIQSDNAEEMIDSAKEWIDANPGINWNESVFKIYFANDEIFYPLMTITLPFKKVWIGTSGIGNLASPCETQSGELHQMAEECRMTELMDTCLASCTDNVLRNEIKKLILFLVDFYKSKKEE